MRYNAWATVLIGLSALCSISWRSRLVRALGIAIASVALLSLTTSCSVSRKAVSEHSELKIESSETVERVDSVIVEQRDTLREVLGRAKRQSRATTITIDRNDKGDTLKVVQITDLTRARSRVGVAAQRVKTEVRVDTVYVEKRDSVMVQNTGLTNPTAIYRTICAFANDIANEGGGYIVVGVMEVSGRAVQALRGAG